MDVDRRRRGVRAACPGEPPPRYSSVSVDGPTGPIKSERWRFGPGGLVSYNRVVADQESVTVEMAD